MNKRIALVGVYGGLMRDYNPGCFMIARESLRQLKRRIRRATFVTYSIDMSGRYPGMRAETQTGLVIRFCSASHQLDLLDHELSHYDALVVGGDNVWMASAEIRATHAHNDVFFLNSPAFQVSYRPVVAINCASTTSESADILNDRDRFQRACARARYVAVRPSYLADILRSELGVREVSCVPDPVLGVDPGELRHTMTPVALDRQKKPRLGIAVRPAIVDALIAALKEVGSALDRFEVWVYPYSRLHWHLESVHRIRSAFGRRFNYIDRHRGPLASFLLAGSFDVSLNDTYHGTISAVVHGKAFIALRFLDRPRSRRAQLMQDLGLADRSILMHSGGLPPSHYDQDVTALAEALPGLLDAPSEATPKRLDQLRERTDQHFDCVADTIRDS